MNPQSCIRCSSDEDSPGTAGFARHFPPAARRILVADDNEAIRHFLSGVLARCGFEVTAVSDGQQAWESLVLGHYDLLITDNDMPNLTGEELISRASAAGLSVPVIVASGSFSSGQPGELAGPAVAAVLPKPFGVLELLNTVRRILPEQCAGDFTVRRLRPVAATGLKPAP